MGHDIMNTTEIVRLLTLAEEAARLARSIGQAKASLLADVLVQECAEAVYREMDAEAEKLMAADRARPRPSPRRLIPGAESVVSL